MTSTQPTMEIFLRGRQYKKALEQASRAIRADYGLKQIEVDILSFLSYSGPVTSSEIYRTLSLNKGHVSQAMASLCTKGMLRVKPDPHDTRRIAFHLSKQAAPIVESIQKARARLLEKVLRGVTEDELAVIQSVTEKVYANLDQLVTV